MASLQRGGAFGAATLQANQIGDPDALLALRVNGADLSLDHGYPARIIVPALPGVHNTKWVAAIDFEAELRCQDSQRVSARVYGSHPLHLLTMLSGFALLGYILATFKPATLWNPGSWWQSIVVWFAAAVIAHDLLLFPLYALADRVLSARTGRPGDRPAATQKCWPATTFGFRPWAAGLTLLIFLPGIIEQGGPDLPGGHRTNPAAVSWAGGCCSPRRCSR